MSKNKEKKGKESTIGKIIYGFLLFMPLIAIGVTCLYTIFNKNAYKSYSASEQITTFSPINSNLQYNKKYFFDTDSNQLTTSSNQSISVYSNESFTINSTIIAENKLNTFRLLKTGSDYVVLTYYDNNDILQTGYFSFNNTAQVTFKFEVGSDIQIESVYNDYIKEINTNIENYIDNVFYYSIDKVEQSNLFNWAKNSIVYTTLLTTCNALSITNTFIPMLLAYWLIISVIYILYDIALMMILIFHHKVHCLEDSI